jgi:hypothetical protein
MYNIQRLILVHQWSKVWNDELVVFPVFVPLQGHLQGFFWPRVESSRPNSLP